MLGEDLIPESFAGQVWVVAQGTGAEVKSEPTQKDSENENMNSQKVEA